MPSEQIRSARIVLLKLTRFPYIAGIWVYEELKALGNRWQPTPRLQKHRNLANHKRITSGRLRRPVNGSRSGTPAPRTPVNGGQLPSADITEQESEAPFREARTGRNLEIERLRSLIKKFMIVVEADGKQSKSAPAAYDNATRELSTYVQALTEKIEAEQISAKA